jgi:hypothetical protein
MNTTTATPATVTTPELAEKILPQSSSKEHKVYTPEEVNAFCKNLHDTVNNDPEVKALTKGKNWVNIRQDGDRIVANICGPLRKVKSETGEKITPLFSICVPLMSTKVLGPMLPFAGHNNHWANKDFLKRLHAVSGALLAILEASEKK